VTKPRASAPEPGFQVSRKLTGECPLCGKPKLDVTRKPPGSRPPYHIGCWVCCPPDAEWYEKRDYLAALAEVVDCRPYQLLDDPLTHLGFLLDRPTPVASVKHVPLNETAVGEWRAALLASPSALSYLVEQRGLTLETIERYGLGYDVESNAITFPVRDEAGELVNLRRRYLAPDADPPIRGLARPASLYPDVPASGGLLLVAGEFDALTGRQLDLPTITTTCGAALPDHLAPQLAGRMVYVMHDVGEERAAERTAGKLLALGSQAFVVRLRLLGLPDKSDLNDFYTQGGTAQQIRALCHRERRAA
jgi:DNA primase